MGEKNREADREGRGIQDGKENDGRPDVSMEMEQKWKESYIGKWNGWERRIVTLEDREEGQKMVERMGGLRWVSNRREGELQG